MYTDIGLRLATNESVANSGNGGLGEGSTAVDPTTMRAVLEALKTYSETGGGERIVMNINIDTSFASAQFGATCEFQLVWLPIQADKLDNGAGGAGDGKLLSVSAPTLGSDPGDNELTITDHGLPVGAAVYFSDVGTLGGGTATNTLYYAIPTDANSFQLAASLAEAVAGTPAVSIVGAPGSAVLEFVPTIQASTGAQPMYDAPANSGPLVRAAAGAQVGRQIQAPLHALVGPNPKEQMPLGQTEKQPLGAGPYEGLVAANALKYAYLRYVVSDTVTAGAVTVDLVRDAGDALKFYRPGMEHIG